MFFSQLVLPRVGAPCVTFVTKTAVKCMRPHSLGDSSSTEFLSHFPSAGRRVQGPTSRLSRPSSPRVRRNAKPLLPAVGVDVVAAKILTPLRGDATALLVRPKSLSIPRETKTGRTGPRILRASERRIKDSPSIRAPSHRRNRPRTADFYKIPRSRVASCRGLRAISSRFSRGSPARNTNDSIH